MTSEHWEESPFTEHWAKTRRDFDTHPDLPIISDMRLRLVAFLAIQEAKRDGSSTFMWNGTEIQVDIPRMEEPK